MAFGMSGYRWFYWFYDYDGAVHTGLVVPLSLDALAVTYGFAGYSRKIEEAFRGCL
jgi:hypothetical protein